MNAARSLITPHKHIWGDEMKKHVEVTPKGTTTVYFIPITKEQFNAKINPVVAKVLREIAERERANERV